MITEFYYSFRCVGGRIKKKKLPKEWVGISINCISHITTRQGYRYTQNYEYSDERERGKERCAETRYFAHDFMSHSFVRRKKIKRERTEGRRNVNETTHELVMCSWILMCTARVVHQVIVLCLQHVGDETNTYYFSTNKLLIHDRSVVIDAFQSQLTIFIQSSLGIHKFIFPNHKPIHW